jgi:hypothetical protein
VERPFIGDLGMKIIAFAFAAACIATTAYAAKPPKPAAAPSPPAVPAEPYDFRGAQVGMTLEDFKKMPFPDAGAAADKHYGVATAARIELHCSIAEKPNYSDPNYVYVSDDFRGVGGIKCVYKVPPLESYQRSWRDADITVGTHFSDNVNYLFYPDPAGVLRLGDVGITMGNQDFDALAAALTGKLGKPTAVEEKDLQNGMGNHFKSAELTWDNGVSIVKLEQRHGKIDEMELLYTSTELSHAFYAKISAAKPPKL